MHRTFRSASRALAAFAAASVAATGLALVPSAAAAAPADEAVEASITVPKIDGLSPDFIGGVDVSSVLSLEESGVVFRDASGQPGDLFEILAGAGVTDVRIRVWNDPFDAAGNGYGGGNVDVDRGVTIGERATDAGLGVLVDFHYSDFWADPAKQQSPKAWMGDPIDVRADKVYDFTADALARFKAADVDVEMVQVGNETNNGVAGVTSWADRAQVFSAGAKAVRDSSYEALVALHFTNPETAGRYASIAKELADRGVDYDVFASSYYPFWHGSTENLTAVLKDIADTYGKKVLVAETSWAYTLADGDGHGNVIDLPEEATQYPVSEQGQAWALRDVMAAVAEVGDAGLGVYYWEPAWLPVGPPSALDANKALWERDGSGWASSFAGSYEAHDAGVYFGGSAWENQALFAFDGTPLDTLNTFSYARTGSVAPLDVVEIERVAISIEDGESFTLPEAVSVTYNDRSVRDASVTWTSEGAAPAGPGTYSFTGTVDGGHTTTATVEIRERNFLRAGGFEGDDLSAWTLTGTGTTLGSASDPRSGDRSTHFWSDADYGFVLEQTVTGLPAGTYSAGASVQGDGEKDGDAVTITVVRGQTDAAAPTAASSSAARGAIAAAPADGAAEAPSEASAAFELGGWLNWSSPETETIEIGADGTATVRIEASLSAGAWGTVDDVTLTRVAAAADTTALSAALARVDGIDRAAFTPASVAAVDAAAADARRVAAALAPTQASADAALAALTAAIDGLVAVAPTVPVPTDPTDPTAPTDGTGTTPAQPSGTAAAAGASALASTGGSMPVVLIGLAVVMLAAGATALGLRGRAR